MNGHVDRSWRKKRNEMYENMDSKFMNIDMKVSRCAID